MALHLFNIENLSPADVEIFIQHGADVNERDEAGFTTLFKAIEKCDAPLVSALLAAGADPNLGHGAKDHGRPLFTAVQGAMNKIVELLLNFGADISIIEDNPDVLHELLSDGHEDTVIILVNSGLNVNICGSSFGFSGSLLITAISLHHDDLARALLNANIDVNLVDVFEQSALHQAVIQMNFSLVRELIDRGAKINASDLLGDFPLGLAIQTDQYEMASLLTVCGADHSLIQNSELGNSLQMAIHNDNQRMISLAIGAGSDINYVNHQGHNVLDTCLLRFRDHVNDDTFVRRMTELFNFLVSIGARLSRMDSYPFVPDFIFVYGTVMVVKLLIDFGLIIKFGSTNSQFRPPLHTAVMNQSKDMFNYLIEEHHADLSCRDNMGNNLLHVCASRLDISQIKWLLELGLDIEHRNIDNVSVLQTTVQFDLVNCCFKILINKCSAQIIYDCLLFCLQDDKYFFSRWIVKHVAIEKFLRGHPDYVLFDFDELPQFLKEYYQECQEELSLSLGAEIGGISVSTLLQSNKKSVLVNNEMFMNEYADANLSRDYPIYHDVLQYKIGRAIFYQSLLNNARSHFCQLFGVHPTALFYVVNNIFQHLSETDLHNIVRL